MLIYRIESPDTRRGPFRPGVKQTILTDREWDRVIKLVKRTYDGDPNTPCPCPHDDLERCSPDQRQRFWSFVERENPKSSRRGVNPDDLLFGCRTPEEFDHWFPAEAKRLLTKDGYQEAVYSVPDDRVLELTVQAAFLRRDAELVQWRQLDAEACLKAA